MIYIILIYYSSYHGQERLERVPHFLSVPSNSRFREGSAVRLTCEATGIKSTNFTF